MKNEELSESPADNTDPSDQGVWQTSPCAYSGSKVRLLRTLSPNSPDSRSAYF